jgi:hypothetical protein
MRYSKNATLGMGQIRFSLLGLGAFSSRDGFEEAQIRDP